MKLIRDLGLEYPTTKSKRKFRYGIYECPSCFSEIRVKKYDVDRGHTSNCRSCHISKKNTTHKDSKTRLYNIWKLMKQRCYNPNNPKFEYYGGRNIKVCEEWSNYIVFKEWSLKNGYVESLTIDRENNDGNYEPDNCRWVTQKVQARNTRLLRSSNTSGYRGVHKHTHKCYVASINIDGKAKHLKYDKSALVCAKAYDDYVINNKLEHTINNI